MTKPVEESVFLNGFHPHIQQAYLNEIILFLETKIKNNFNSRGYESTKEITTPLRKEKNVPEHYKNLQGSKILFCKGSEFGTSIEFSWHKDQLDVLKIKMEEAPKRKANISVLSGILLSILFYSLTIYYWEYWLYTIALGLICLLIPIILAIAPGIIGFLIGFVLGEKVYRVTVSPEVVEHNYKDLVFVHKELMIYVNQLTISYRQRVNQMATPVYNMPYP